MTLDQMSIEGQLIIYIHTSRGSREIISVDGKKITTEEDKIFYLFKMKKELLRQKEERRERRYAYSTPPLRNPFFFDLYDLYKIFGVDIEIPDIKWEHKHDHKKQAYADYDPDPDYYTGESRIKRAMEKKRGKSEHGINLSAGKVLHLDEGEKT